MFVDALENAGLLPPNDSIPSLFVLISMAILSSFFIFAIADFLASIVGRVLVSIFIIVSFIRVYNIESASSLNPSHCMTILMCLIIFYVVALFAGQIACPFGKYIVLLIMISLFTQATWIRNIESMYRKDTSHIHK